MLTSPKVIKANSFNGTINLEWENVKDADSYNMYYSNIPNFTKQNARTMRELREMTLLYRNALPHIQTDWNEMIRKVHFILPHVKNPNVVKFAINKVPPGSYHYRIVSVKGGKESVWSEESSILVGTCQLSAPPSDLKKEIQENGDIKISWSPDSTADGYVLHLTSEDGFEHRKIELMILSWVNMFWAIWIIALFGLLMWPVLALIVVKEVARCQSNWMNSRRRHEFSHTSHKFETSCFITFQTCRSFMILNMFGHHGFKNCSYCWVFALKINWTEIFMSKKTSKGNHVELSCCPQEGEPSVFPNSRRRWILLSASKGTSSDRTNRC